MNLWPVGPYRFRFRRAHHPVWLALLSSLSLALPSAPLQGAITSSTLTRGPSWPFRPAPQKQDSASLLAGDRPKLGLVLSGGSARGFAHIGVIRVLDQAGLKFDVVTGTSMGSIIGAMQATGYPPELMLRVATSADWDRLFDDNALRKNLPLERKAEVDRLMFTVPIRRGRPTLPGGFIAGQRIGQFFALLTWRVHPVHDFRALPVDYAAVATDAETGEAVRLEGGYLPEAMRASSAIPSVFAPVEVDGRLLMDGGVSRNLPAEDARALGAELLVCSDVSKPLMPADSLDNLLAVLDQTIGYRGWESTVRQRQLCDVLILPDINGLSSTAFDKAEEWAARGDSAARAALVDIVELGLIESSAVGLRAEGSGGPETGPVSDAPTVSDPYSDSVYVARVVVAGLRGASPSFVHDHLRLTVPGWVRLADLDAGVTRLYDTGRFRIVKYRLEAPEGHAVPGGPTSDNDALSRSDDRLLRLEVVEQRLARLGLGYRYESRYKASVLASATLFDLLSYGTRLEVDVRLGEQGRAEARSTTRFGRAPAFIVGLGGGYRRAPFDIYVSDLRDAIPRAYVTHIELAAGVALGNAALLGLRLKGENADLDEFAAAGEPFTGDSRAFATAAALITFDSYDRALFPRSGARVVGKSEHRIAGEGGFFAQHVLDAEGALTLRGGLSLLGRLTIGTSDHDIPDHYYFFLGGTNRHYLLPDRHFPFAGLRTMERFGRHLQTIQLGLQYEFHPYAVSRIRWNAGAVLDEWAVDGNLLTYGFDVTLGAVTRLGHAALSLVVLDLKSLPRVVLDVGYPF